MLKSKIFYALYLALVDVINESMEHKVHMDASQFALNRVFLACIEGN